MRDFIERFGRVILDGFAFYAFLFVVAMWVIAIDAIVNGGAP